MSRYFLATIPIVTGQPVWAPNIATPTYDGDGNITSWTAGKRIEVFRTGDFFLLKQHHSDSNIADVHRRHGLAGEFLGRLDEGQFGTSGKPAVIVATGRPATMQFFKDQASGNPAYRFETLESAWQITAGRKWLKNDDLDGAVPLATTRIRWVAGGFGPVPLSTYGRPALRRVYGGQHWDLFPPENP